MGTSLRLVGVYLIYVFSPELSRRAQGAGARVPAGWFCHNDRGLSQPFPSPRKAILQMRRSPRPRYQRAHLCP
jgi:hypothetical protein